MSHSDVGEKYVCPKCIGDHYLSEQIKASQGVECKCSYCGNDDQPCFSISDLADRVHQVIENQYDRTPAEPDDFEYAMTKAFDREWERTGTPVRYVIEELLRANADIASDILVDLSIKHRSSFSPKDFPNEEAYDETAHYELKAPDGGCVLEQWNDLKKDLSSKSRFFSPKAALTLDAMFHDIEILRTHDSVPVIKTLKAGHEQRIYRARVTYSDDELKNILADPVKELEAPPSRFASSGRMNAKGIVCFYGAEDVDTSISETRPPVGSHVVVGEFEIIRDVRLLDFDLLSQVYASGSPFDPDYVATWQKSQFFKYLIVELTKPVMPEKEDAEYLPTQFLADYLANKEGLNIDGIIFHSSQTDRPERNVVIFNKSCKVARYDIPKGTKVDVSLWNNIPDEDPDEISVFERLPAPSANEERRTPRVASDLFFPRQEKNAALQRDTLRLNVASIKVFRIRASSYRLDDRTVSRRRSPHDSKLNSRPSDDK